MSENQCFNLILTASKHGIDCWNQITFALIHIFSRVFDNFCEVELPKQFSRRCGIVRTVVAMPGGHEVNAFDSQAEGS